MVEADDWRRNPDAVEAALRTRISNLAHRMIDRLDHDAKLDVLSAPDSVGFLIAILEHLPSIEVVGDTRACIDLPDDFAERLVAQRGSIPRDVSLDV